MRWLATNRHLSFTGSQGYIDLARTCSEDSKRTELVPVTDIRDLSLHPAAGQTRNRLRYNQAAFQQVCSQLSGALFSLLAALDTDAKPCLIEAVIAERQARLIGIFNAALRQVGEQLVGRRLVVDGDTIVGLVGRHYRYVSNADLLSAVKSYSEAKINERHTMVRGSLHNRDLFMLLVRRPYEVTAGGVVLREGTAVYNSETTRSAIFLPNVLFDSETASYSHATETDENRLIHRKKKKFAEQLSVMIESAFSGESQLGAMRERVLLRQATALCEPSRREMAFRAISGKLVERKVNATPIDRVISLLRNGERISQWSLYSAMLRTANEYVSSDRRLRMAAYRYLVESRL